MNKIDHIASGLYDKKGGVLGLRQQIVAPFFPSQLLHFDYSDIYGYHANQLDFLILGEEAFLLCDPDQLKKFLCDILRDHGIMLLWTEISPDASRHNTKLSSFIQTISLWNHFEFITKTRHSPFDIYLLRYIRKLPSFKTTEQIPDKSVGTIIDQKLNSLLNNHPLVYNILRKIYLRLQRTFTST